MVLNPITLITGIAFAPLAGACAYIITYGEYQRHYPDNKMPRKPALEAAIGTLYYFYFCQ